MTILFNNDIDRTEWSSLVQSSSTGTWFQTPAAYDFFASMPELFKPSVLGVASDPAGAQTQLRGVCVGYVTVEKNPIKQFFTRRGIIIGGPCLADDAPEEEVEALMSAVKEQLRSKAIYIETRNFNDYSRWRDAFAKAGFSYQPHLNFHVDTSSVEIVEANLGKSRKRDIRTTIREGVTITSIYDLGLQIDDFERARMVHEYYAILKDLYITKVKTPLFPESFFQTLVKIPDARFL